MRSAILMAVLGFTSTAAADNLLWNIAATENTPLTPHVFRIATSETAYIEHQVGPNNERDWLASDGPNVAALFADLTDSIDGDITFSTEYFSHTVDESYFWTNHATANPLISFATELAHGPNDLAGFIINRFHISVRYSQTAAPPRRYSVEIAGIAPEPSSAFLFVLGFCAFGHFQYRRKVSTRLSQRAPLPAVSTST